MLLINEHFLLRSTTHTILADTPQTLPKWFS
ncbi:hypothetical protein PC119_g5691 [Phytophthora cactorum]|nr:hypothetical protein PC111_g4752 [Phytophthora cactorum]KAG3032486.1 hypothetical protein PC119_g5691 [Phytophthora cactorum]